MIAHLASTLLRTRCGAAHITALLGLTGLAAFSSAQAAVPSVQPNAVVGGDTFGIELIAYNINKPSDNYPAIATALFPVFGTTTPYGSDGPDGQTLTVSSVESSNNGIFTDTISISVPTNFVPADDQTFADGQFVTALDFSIGLVPSTSGTNPIDFTSPISLISVTGSATYSGGSIGLTQNPVLTNGSKSFSNQESVQSSGNSVSISGYDVNAFSVTVTYALVPEPSTNAAVLLGAAGLIGMFVARNRRRARA